MEKTTSTTNKHIPQRTCIACRQVKAKRQLIRLVALPSGGVEVDTDSRKAGRGAYMCPTFQCWQTGLVGGRLEYVLRTSLTQENREQLTQFGKKLDRELVSG
jgi:predicted RNA-binding protein YlxR (DUF448 family)